MREKTRVRREGLGFSRKKNNINRSRVFLSEIRAVFRVVGLHPNPTVFKNQIPNPNPNPFGSGRTEPENRVPHFERIARVGWSGCRVGWSGFGLFVHP